MVKVFAVGVLLSLYLTIICTLTSLTLLSSSLLYSSSLISPSFYFNYLLYYYFLHHYYLVYLIKYQLQQMMFSNIFRLSVFLVFLVTIILNLSTNHLTTII